MREKTLPILVFGYKADAFDADDTEYLASVLLSDLAFGEISDIYKKLVINEQKVQFVSASAGSSRDPGLFYIYTMIKNEDDVEYVKNEILNTLEYYKNNKVDSNVLENLKKRKKYSFLMALDNPDNVASSLPRYITLTGGIDVIDVYYTNMDKITPEDIQNAAKKYFSEERKNLVSLKGEK
jgi:zinc protease